MEFSLIDSKILQETDYEFLKENIDFDINLELIFRASRDGYSAENFHSKCDDMGPSLTIVQSEYGYRFGGYSKISWISHSKVFCIADSDAFIFSLTHKTKHT